MEMERYRVWMMCPSRSFAGESYVIKTQKRPLYDAIIALEYWAMQKFGEVPERIEKI